LTSLDPPTPVPAAETDTTPAAPSARPKPSVLLRGWIFFVVTALVVLAGAAGQIASRPVRWSAQAVIAFVPVGERPVSAVSVTLMVPRYVAYASSPYVVRQAAVAVGVAAPELQTGLTVTLPATTANVTVTVSARTPVVASEAANRIAALVIERASVDPLLGGRMLADAPVPVTPAGPSQATLLAGAVAAALALGALAAFGVRWYTRRRYPWLVRTAGMAPLLVSSTASGTVRRPAPGGGSAMGTVPRPHPERISSTYPGAGFGAAADERLWSRIGEPIVLADTVEMPAVGPHRLDDEDTVEFDAAAPIEVARNR
jgi:hypothetical protein